MRRSIHSPRSRRRGQALLLAVLIMIFAALLSAAFIGVVAVNLNQTARQGDKNIARDSARAGLAYINRQLTYSAQGDRWRPTLPSTLPVNYYTAFDRAQRWDNGYVKYPNPDGTITDSPQFLAKVERIDSSLPLGDPDRVRPDRFGSLRITVIGLSPEDPTAFHKTVAYKGGYLHAPVAQTMRVVSNYDFKRGEVMVAQGDPLNTATTNTNDGTSATDPAIDISSSRGDFSQLGVPFTITLSDPRNGVAAQSAVVTEVVDPPLDTQRTQFTLRLAKPLATAITATTRVELAANIGAPDKIDYGNEGGAAGTKLTASGLQFRFSDGPVAATTENTDGARVNGGLVLSGDLIAAKLRPISKSFGTALEPPGSIQASGVIARDIDNAGTVANAQVAQPDGTQLDTLVASSNAANGVFATSLTLEKDQMVSDGWNRIKGVPPTNNSVRTVADFRPPVIDSGEGLERYRKLSQMSSPRVATAPSTASLYGYGQGIYIDNVQDKEKIYDASPGILGFREMSQSELVQMWMSQWTGTPATTPSFMRTGIPNLPTDPNASLEQKHVRGWTGPDEFRARGVEIDIEGNQLRITRDARDEAGSPLLDKAWKDTNGNPQTGEYTELLDWPVNGVLFAEGNVRIKGIAANVPRSLTVVSMGNIYIEGDLGIGSFVAPAVNPPKILLMAKKNVVMNPTRLLGSPDVQTTTAQAQTLATGNAVALQVNNALGFRRGDFVQAGSIQGYVDADPTTRTSLPINVVTAGSVAINDVIYTPNTTSTATTSTIPSAADAKNVAFSSIVSNTDAVQRRLTLPDTLPAGVALADLRLAFNHEAERKTAATVAIAPTGGGALPTTPVYFSHKAVFVTPPPVAVNYAATVLGQADRLIRGDYTEPNTGTDTFPGTAPTTEVDAQAATIDSLFATGSGTIDATSHVAPPPGTIGWKYTTSAASDFRNLPFYYLAGIGNRVDFGAPTVPAERRVNLNGLTTAYNIPLAVSINVAMNGVDNTGVNNSIFNENWNTTAANYDKTTQFGFRPTFVDPPAPEPANEDILTGDQSFYQTDAQQSTLDSRSFYNAATNFNRISTGRNSLVLRQSGGLVPPTGPGPLPAYMLLGTKLENVTIAPGTSNITRISTPHTFNVNAFVYAQTGSWFVIPAPLFDERLRGTLNTTTGVPISSFLDINNNGTAEAGEYLDVDGSGTYTAGDFADLNRDGDVSDPAEQLALLRYSRYNYAINFTGAIAENQTVVVNDAGSAVKGAVSEWMSRWATTDFNGTTATPGRIQYFFDPSVVQGDLATDDGFKLPQTEELYNIS